MDINRKFLPLRLVGPTDRDVVGSVLVFELTQRELDALVVGKPIRERVTHLVRVADRTYPGIDEIEIRPRQVTDDDDE